MLESFSFRTAIQETTKMPRRRVLGRVHPDWRAPELPIVLLEDFAALIGLVFALFGVGLTLITDNGSGTRSAPSSSERSWSWWRSCWRSR